MNATSEQSGTTQANPKLLTFASAGWVFVVAAVLVLGIILWQVTYILPTLGKPVVGDGRTVASYGFDLSQLSVPEDLVVAAGFAKDGLPILSSPRIIKDPNELIALHKELRKAHIGKALVDDELVIGVEINGEARAYPQRILALHELYHDTLGGEPILVTYSPLTDSAMVFDRRVAGKIRDFGISGLLYNSNTLVYDLQPTGDPESLWSQLGAEAISGPAVGTSLRVVPFRVLPWGAWLELYPDTTAILPQGTNYKRYKRLSYTMYYGSEKIRYPVPPLPSETVSGLRAFERILAVPSGSGWEVKSIVALLDGRPAEIDSVLQVEVAGRVVNLTSTPLAAWLSEVDDKPAVRSLWFGWHAMHDAERAMIEK